MGDRAGLVETRHDPAEQQMRARLAGAMFGEAPEPVKVGRYVVLEQIGSGGLGVVYSAYDPELDRKVALKLVKPTMVHANAAARMQREAQAMARVRHANVVAVYDAGPHAGGVFIAMELVDGVTLSQWTRQHAQEWKAVRDVLVGAGEGLAAAHREGLVHRDFKPANVLVEASGQARVLDFGLARAAEGSVHRAAQTTAAEPSQSKGMLAVDVTRTGAVLGTPAYMAPEQFDGDADERSDQWGFCVAAYEMLFGTRPFSGSNADEICDAVTEGRVPKPDGSSPVPAWLFRALARGMSVDAAKRYESMDALLVDLQRDKRSRRLQLAGVSLAVLLSSGVTAAALWTMQPQPSAESRSTVERLELDARDAAKAGRFVYPDRDDPELPTALVSVIALEQLDGAIEPEAERRAAALREEFASSLVALGDRYWEEETAFASDFYAAALLFDPQTARARERSPLTPGELSVLRDKAEQARFSDVEVSGAAPLAALAEPDPERRDERVRALLAEGLPAADSTAQRLERLVERDGTKATPRTPATDASHAPPTEAAKAPPEDSAVADPPVQITAPTKQEPVAQPPPDPPEATATSGASKRDPDAAREEARAGRAALQRGADREAEAAFHRALAKDSRNDAALLGLSEIHFERADYHKALSFAKKAAAVAPKRAAVRMQLGDAYFKVHRYDDARTEYQAAADLGAKGAARQLERIEQRLGESP